MINAKLSGTVIGASLLSAIAASLCCITPVIALLAGSSSIAANFSWIEPARPYLIGLSITILAFAWYRKFKLRFVDDCNCLVKEKPNLIQSKGFLIIMSIFAVLMIAFPYYSKAFFPNDKKQAIATTSNIQTAEFKISGMNCSGCEEEVKHEVNKDDGVISVEVSYKNASAKIKFDNSKTTINQIKKAINLTGYKVIYPLK